MTSQTNFSYEEHPVTDVADAAISTSIAAAMAVPIWAPMRNPKYCGLMRPPRPDRRNETMGEKS